MKKGIVIVLFLMLVLSLISLASSQDDALADASGVGGDIKDAAATISTGVNDKLTEEVTIPSNLQLVSRYIFGLNAGEKIDLQTLVVLVALWIMLFIILYSIFKIMPLFGKGIKSIVAVVVVCLIISISGGINEIAQLFLSIAGFVDFLGKYAILRLIVSLAILAVIMFGVLKVLKSFGGQAEVMEAETVGMNVSVKPLVQQLKNKGI